MLDNKIKRIEYKQLKPGNIIVYGEILKNKPSFDCMVLAVDYENKSFQALTRNHVIKQYPLVLGTLYVIDNSL